jgi:hypothetical protein
MNFMFLIGHDLFTNYDIFRDICYQNVRKYCSDDEQNDMLYALIGIAALLQDVKESSYLC